MTDKLNQCRSRNALRLPFMSEPMICYKPARQALHGVSISDTKDGRIIFTTIISHFVRASPAMLFLSYAVSGVIPLHDGRLSFVCC